MLSKTYIYLLVCCSLLTACTNIEGTYVANHNDGNDTLKIYSDKFVRIYRTTDKLQTFVDTGKWEVTDGHINFSNWKKRSEATDRSSSGEKIYYGIDVDRSFFSGKTKLVINYDLEYYYIKK